MKSRINTISYDLLHTLNYDDWVKQGNIFLLSIEKKYVWKYSTQDQTLRKFPLIFSGML